MRIELPHTWLLIENNLHYIYMHLHLWLHSVDHRLHSVDHRLHSVDHRHIHHTKCTSYAQGHKVPEHGHPPDDDVGVGRLPSNRENNTVTTNVKQSLTK